MTDEGGANAKCPRCGGGFYCGAQDGHCDCFELKLGEALREQLRQQYGGAECLCLGCLRSLAAGDASPIPPSKPS